MKAGTLFGENEAKRNSHTRDPNIEQALSLYPKRNGEGEGTLKSIGAYNLQGSRYKGRFCCNKREREEAGQEEEAGTLFGEGAGENSDVVEERTAKKPTSHRWPASLPTMPWKTIDRAMAMMI